MWSLVLLRCGKCKEMRPKGEFQKDITASRGVSYKCKPCKKEYMSQYYQGDKEKFKAISRTNRRPEKFRVYAANARAKYPKKAKARSVVSNAIRSGELKRLACKACGSGQKIEFHHSKGYEKEFWLTGVWLCREHHVAEHCRLVRRGVVL